MNKVFLRKICMIFLLSAPMYFGQVTSLDFERISIKEGLSNNSVNCILQTSNGFLWIATKDGLNRFDGKSFKIYKYNSDDSTSLPQNYVMSLLEDSDKNLWVGTWGGGLCKFIPDTESFLSYNFLENYDDYVQCLFQDKNNDIWIGTVDGGLNRLNIKDNSLTNYSSLAKKDYYFPTNNITCITQADSMFWIGTWDKGLFKVNFKHYNFTQYQFDETTSNSELPNLVWNIFRKNPEELLLSTNDGVIKFNTKTSKMSRILAGKIVRQIIKDSKNRLWIGTYDYTTNYIFENDELTEVYYKLKYADNDPYTLTSDRVRWMYKDKLNHIWVGTEDGLNKLPKTQEFVQYKYFPLGSSTLAGRVVSSIYEGGDNVLWVGYGGGGFNKINLKNGKTDHFLNEYGNSNSLSSSDVVTIFEDSEGLLWIGTRSGGLNRFDPKNGKFQKYCLDSHKDGTIRSNWVHQILELNTSTLLIGTNKSLEIFYKDKEKFGLYKPELNSESLRIPDSLSVNALFKDSKNNIWIGTWLDGLYQYDTHRQKINHFLPQKGNSNSISSNKITSIYEDSQKSIWIGTHSGGVNKFIPKDMGFAHYNTQNGMPNDVVFGILEDDNGFLWFSTMNGLVKFNPSTEQFRIYNRSDGLINNQFNWHAYFKNKEGILYFGGINGFVAFNPENIVEDLVTHPVSFISFKVNDKEIKNSSSLFNGKLIELDYYQNFFSVEYTVLDFILPNKHNYLYKLNGLDENWIEAGSSNVASYTDIEPGEYELLVKASNPDGFWSDVSNLKILINPPWWSTWWFRIGAFVFLGAIGFFIYEFRVNQLLAIERIKLNISRDLHDEIGSNLSSISVESQMLINSKNLDPIEKLQISHIKKVSVETMEAMRDIIWFINPQNEWGKEFLLKMRETASNLLIGISWNFITPKELNLTNVNLEAKRNIFLIYKEALINITKHSEADTCQIHINSTLNKFTLRINDNGIGFDENTLKRKNGLVNIQNRADKIGAKIKIESGHGKGTNLVLELNRFI